MGPRRCASWGILLALFAALVPVAAPSIDSRAAAAPPATGSPDSTSVVEGEGPQPPRDLYPEASRSDQVELSWQPGSEPPADVAQSPSFPERYEVYRDGQLIATTGALKLIDSWLLERHRYTYVVRALDELGRSAESQPVTIDTPAFDAGLEGDPYLQQLSPVGVTIVWHTFSPATTSLYFAAVGAPETSVERDLSLRRDHVVSINGLTPGTLYTYRWESDGRIGPQAQFRTPPAAQPRFSFGVIGDYGLPTPAARANLRRLSHDGIDFAISTGDNAQRFGTEVEYRHYVIRPLRSFLSHRPFWPSIGNHDYYGLGNYHRYFVLPSNERYYSFDYGGVLFLSLDSSRFNARQRRWLRRKLRSSTARCKVAYFHHPLWSSAVGYRSFARKLRRQRFVPILQRGGVDLVFNGHVQNYERSRPLRRGRPSRRGIVYVVTGGGGARLNPFVTRRKPRWSARRGLFHHRLRVTVRGHRFKVKAIDTLGRTRDRFTVPCR